MKLKLKPRSIKIKIKPKISEEKQAALDAISKMEEELAVLKGEKPAGMPKGTIRLPDKVEKPKKRKRIDYTDYGKPVPDYIMWSNQVENHLNGSYTLAMALESDRLDIYPKDNEEYRWRIVIIGMIGNVFSLDCFADFKQAHGLGIRELRMSQIRPDELMPSIDFLLSNINKIVKGFNIMEELSA